jgi:tetratricopeptide (TPR) repeat protein
MRSTYPVGHFSKVLVVVVTGLACVFVVGTGRASQAEVSEADEATVMANYRAAMASGNETAAVKYLLGFTAETRGENAPATAKLTYRYGYLLYRDGEYREATDVLKTALERSTVAFGESGAEAFEINMNIGYALSQWSPSPSRRTKYFDRALEILRERGEHESIKYVTTLVNIVVNLMDNDGLSGGYSSALGDDYERYIDGEVSSYTPEQEYSNYFDEAEKYVLEAVELSKKLESQDEYLSSKIAIAQAKLNVMATADLAAVPAGVRGRITSGTAKERNALEEERLMSAIDKLSKDVDNNKVFLAAANKALMEIAWLDKDGERMLAMCTDGTLNSASEYHPDRLYAIAEDGSVLAPNFSFRVTSNIFKPVVRSGDEPTDKNGNPVRKPYFIPVCIDGRLMAALINAPTVTIEEFR